MRAIALLLSVALLVGGCSKVSEDDSGAANADGEVVIDDTGKGAMRITSKDGESITVDRRTDNKAQWPKGFAAYPAAVVTSDIAMGGSGRAGKIIAFTSKDTPAEVAEFYRKQAAAAGFEIDMEMSVNEGRMLAGQKPDGTGFAINAAASETGTDASLTVGMGR